MVPTLFWSLVLLCSNNVWAIRNGIDIDFDYPGGNSAIVYASNRIRACSGSMVNNEWMVTAGHCVNRMAAGNRIEIAYGANLEIIYNGTVAETFLDPNYDPVNIPFVFISVVKTQSAFDFGMVRLDRENNTDGLVDTCQNGWECSNTPQVPMNVVFVYELANSFLDKITFGFFSQILAFFGFSPGGFFDRSVFHAFGYGTSDNQREGAFILSTGVYRNSFTMRTLRGSNWLSYWRDRLFSDNDARGCGGDSGGPWMFRGDRDRFALTGLESSSKPCTWLIGFSGARRFDGDTAGWVQDRVESSGTYYDACCILLVSSFCVSYVCPYFSFACEYDLIVLLSLQEVLAPARTWMGTKFSSALTPKLLLIRYSCHALFVISHVSTETSAKTKWKLVFKTLYYICV